MALALSPHSFFQSPEVSTGPSTNSRRYSGKWGPQIISDLTSLSNNSEDIFCLVFQNIQINSEADLTFLERLSITCLILRNCREHLNEIDVLLINEISSILKMNSTLRSFELSSSSLRDPAMFLLSTALQENQSITSLDLSDNLISDTGLFALVDALGTNSTLTSLFLRGNRVTDGGLVKLSTLLQRNTAINFLDISNNPITTQGVLLLLSLLKKLMLDLKCSFNYLGNIPYIEYRKQVFNWLIANAFATTFRFSEFDQSVYLSFQQISNEIFYKISLPFSSRELDDFLDNLPKYSRLTFFGCNAKLSKEQAISLASKLEGNCTALIHWASKERYKEDLSNDVVKNLDRVSNRNKNTQPLAILCKERVRCLVP